MSDFSEINERILGRIFSEDVIYERIKHLCLIGSRFSGTTSEKEAQAYMIHFLKSLGIEVLEHEFEYQGWIRGDCFFEIESKTYNRTFPAISLVLAPSTNGEVIEGLLIDGNGGSETELKRISDEIPGKMLMVNSGDTEEGWLHRRIKYANSVDFGARAFIFANHNPGQLFPTGSVRSNRIGEIPAVGISKETYELIKEIIATEEVVNCKMKVTNKTPKLTSRHIIWEIPGEIEDEVIVIGGHYDGHDIAQGAVDNAASVAVILELARLYKIFNYVPKRIP